MGLSLVKNVFLLWDYIYEVYRGMKNFKYMKNILREFFIKVKFCVSIYKV